jgi:hypothetical protein
MTFQLRKHSRYVFRPIALGGYQSTADDQTKESALREKMHAVRDPSAWGLRPADKKQAFF